MLKFCNVKPGPLRKVYAIKENGVVQGTKTRTSIEFSVDLKQPIEENNNKMNPKMSLLARNL